MVNKIKIGMDYGEAKVILKDYITNDLQSGGLHWFIAPIQEKMYGIYPILQVAARDGKVVEISILPNWDVYEKEGMKVQGREDALTIYHDCIAYMDRHYGQPVKARKFKKAWELEDGTRFKAEYEKRVGYLVHIVIKK